MHEQSPRSDDRCFAASDRCAYPVAASPAGAYLGSVPARRHHAPSVHGEPPRRAPADKPISVVLADDHELMRARLRGLLEEDELIDVIADTNDFGEAVRFVLRNRPRVLVLDLSMPSGSSVEAIRRLRAQLPDTEIVALKMDANAGYARHALDAGAIAYVLKDTADSELAEAVRQAARGERFVSPRVAAALGG
ncbi:MAG TPA: response regulator transcription factor [Solirubrobacteraceae bacterium]|nr:response regulator transcription factor [Solirubrobacteraceae bacterium]